jgi:hypothetical protein
LQKPQHPVLTLFRKEVVRTSSDRRTASELAFEEFSQEPPDRIVGAAELKFGSEGFMNLSGCQPLLCLTRDKVLMFTTQALSPVSASGSDSKS